MSMHGVPKQSLRILHVGKHYTPDVGGIETAMRVQAEGARAFGHRATVLCSKQVPPAAPYKPDGTTLEGVPVYRADTWAKLFSQPICPSMGKIYIRLAENADLIHLHSPNPLVERLVLAHPQKPVVVSYHSDIVSQRALAKIYRPYQIRLFENASRIIVASQNLKETSLTLAPFQDKVDVIPFGLDPAQFVPKQESTQLAKTLNERFGNYILFVGRLVPYKGLKLLLDAYHLLPPSARMQLIIVGEGPMERELQDQISRYDLKNTVHLMGRIDPSPFFDALFMGAQSLVLPSVSRAEAFGIVQLEAMAWSKPTLLSRLESGVLEVNIENKTALMFKPGDPGDLCRALTTLGANPTLARELGESAHRRFLEKFTTTTMIERTLRCYAQALGIDPAELGVGIRAAG